ncbi:MAG TPA: hypothetical protein VLR93_07160 [Patescibacteria group bacterium]|nr:hypothetical protein [Patescibacteria group bacterium]
MPQLLHPSFLRLGRRPAAVLLVLLAIASLVVIVRVQPADASDPYVAGSDPTRVSRLSGPIAATVLDRAIHHERVLGLAPAGTRTVDRVVDRRGHRTYDEVTDLDPRGRPVALFRYALDGRLTAATRLGWQAGTGSPLASASAAVDAAGRLARSLGVQPAGRGLADRRGANGWTVHWDRRVAGVPVPGDGLRVQLWPDGSFHGLTASDHALAARPPTTIAVSAAESIVATLLDRWIPASARGDVRIVGSALAWVAPNDTFEPARPDAPAEIRRLGWVVTVRSRGAFASTIRGLEVAIDAGDGSGLGGDVLR